ncbi:MAG: M18 family aminopeptidase, partial [Gammaproteobacteria bacterium]
MTFNNGLCDFIDKSPTPFHAVANMCEHLTQQGFERLNELDAWGQLP